ncbi:MAG: hypothetical protein ABSE51_14065 [Terracidiphilus sp.]
MRRDIVIAAFAVVGLLIGTAGMEAQQEAPSSSTVVRESLNDAWWTGPILAASGATLPRGHSLIEPYFYDVRGNHTNSFGTSSYVLYGIADGLTVGSIPSGGFNMVSNGLSSSSVGMGDFTLLAQHRLTQFHEGSWVPTTGVVVEETLPIGKYDQLGDRPSNGLGSGTYTTTLGFYPQTYFWLPNGRILRMRFDVTQAFSSVAKVEGVSVYGTTAGFSGNAKPGNSFFADPAWEYSLTRNWVLALDATYRHNWNTRVSGYDASTPGSEQSPTIVLMNTGSSDVFGFAPAIEYNLRSNLGIILGTRVIPASHNTNATITPVMAINFVH